MKMRWGVATVAVALLLFVGFLLNMQAVQAQPIAPAVTTQMTFTLYGPTAVTTGTVNTASPKLDSFARDGAKTTGFNTADVFVTISGSGTFTTVATVQVSADNTNWASAQYEFWNGSAIASHTFASTQTANGTIYMKVPIAGDYLRVNLVNTGTVTPTVSVTYRN